jgi:transposase InsO family protein
MTRLWPSLLGAVQVVQPETILRWHRAGFKMFWRWKSRNRAGRPRIDRGLRGLIRRMSRENPLWGASRIHGELLMLGFEVAQSTVSKYMLRRRNPPSQSWKTFLRNHAQVIAAVDLCVVPTLTFDLLFAFLVLGHGRRQLLWFEVIRHPTAEWLARQITEAFPWTSAPAYLVRDNDRAYGHVFTARMRAMGIRDRPISPGLPWQNGCAERLIGTLRRECLNQVVIFSEMHLRRILSAYAAYYNQARPHLALQKDAPLHRAVQRSGAIVPGRNLSAGNGFRLAGDSSHGVRHLLHGLRGQLFAAASRRQRHANARLPCADFHAGRDRDFRSKRIYRRPSGRGIVYCRVGHLLGVAA